MIEFWAFIFIISLLYAIKNIVGFVIVLLQSDPKPFKLSKIETILLYFALSYVITYIIFLI